MLRNAFVKSLTILVCSIFIFFASFSQSLNVKKFDSLFYVLQNHHLATGSVAISINGKPVYQKAIGFSSRDSNKKTTPDIYTKYISRTISLLK